MSTAGRHRLAAVSWLVALALVAAGCGGGAIDARIAARFSDARADGPAIDHGDWQRVLNRYLVPAWRDVNRVDYAALAADGGALLDAYLAAMAAVDPAAHPRAEQMAYWINVYNALTVRRIATAWPVASILDVGDAGRGPWREPAITVNGVTLTLDDIEHGILRELWDEPRIHFAVNCASIGCPDLQPIVFTGGNLESQLALAARNFLASRRAVMRDGDTLRLSSLFDWYAGDFGDGRRAVLERLAGFADAGTARTLAAHEGPVRYDYDWGINAAR